MCVAFTSQLRWTRTNARPNDASTAANDKSMLEDLILVAVNDGMARAQKMLAEEMGKLGPLSGLQIPGFGNNGFGND